MFESKSIFIEGGAFEQKTELRDILAKRINIVFGHNGSGKSTIARAFREQQAGIAQAGAARKFSLAFDSAAAELPSDDREHLFVFNEDFINENVRVDNLRSIVRIGASAANAPAIQKAEADVQQLETRRQKVQNDLGVLGSAGSVSGSIAEADNAIKAALKKAGGYLERQNRIDGAKHNLVFSLLSPIVDFDRNDQLPASISASAKALEASIDRYLSFNAGAVIVWQRPDFSRLPDLQAVNAILAQQVRPASLTPEEQAILSELEQLASEDFLSKTEEIIVGARPDYCPLCHQPLGDGHRHTLEERIRKFRDKTVEDFKATATALGNSIELIDSTLPTFETNDYDADLSAAEKAVQDLNDALTGIRNALIAKAANPLAVVPAIDAAAFGSIAASAQNALSGIEKDVDAYNQELAGKDALLANINKENVRLAYHENKSWIDEYNDRKAEQARLSSELDSLTAQIIALQNQIGSLQAQADQVDEAREQINKYLIIIFGSNKMRLCPAGKDEYTLQIKNKDNRYVNISADSISSGERNALALAYFFACVMEKKATDYDYKDPTLIVIDDPVSSFDSSNRAGVISLVANQVEKIVSGNQQSKALILTHDQTTLRELCSRRKTWCQSVGEEDEAKDYLLLQRNHILKSCKCSLILETMEYYNELIDICRFAACDNPDEDDARDTIGNTIRKFAESYASRIFKCSWGDLFASNDRPLEPSDIAEVIKAFAIKPVLNSESHSVVESFEPSEVQRAARILLIYMYYNTRAHLVSFLGANNPKNLRAAEEIKMIESWTDDLRA